MGVVTNRLCSTNVASKALPEINRNPFSPQAQALEATKRLSSETDRGAAGDAVATLKRDGYVILERQIDAEKVAQIRAEFERLHDGLALGASDFGGYVTQRLYNLVARTRVLDDLYLNPELLAVIESHLDDQIQLSIASTVNLLPGETAQAFHRDDGYYPMTRPHMPLSVNTMWAVDDFTAGERRNFIDPHLAFERRPRAAIECPDHHRGNAGRFGHDLGWIVVPRRRRQHHQCRAPRDHGDLLPCLAATTRKSISRRAARDREKPLPATAKTDWLLGCE